MADHKMCTSKLEIYTAYLPSGASKIQFDLPFSYNLQILFAWARGQAPMSSPAITESIFNLFIGKYISGLRHLWKCLDNIANF